MPNLIVSAVSTFDNKGLKKGKKEVSVFEKQVKSFAKVFATAFSVTALSRYSKAAVKAFMADEKAAKSLEQQLKNTGYQFSGPAVEMYIANLQKTTGVLDDQLRPAFQQLLTVTGSLTTSQDALNTALNISAGTGKSLTEVTSALSRGYAGNTTGLSRLGAGLSKTLLKTGDMDKIMAELNKKFAGKSFGSQEELMNAQKQFGKELQQERQGVLVMATTELQKKITAHQVNEKGESQPGIEDDANKRAFKTLGEKKQSIKYLNNMKDVKFKGKTLPWKKSDQTAK